MKVKAVDDKREEYHLLLVLMEVCGLVLSVTSLSQPSGAGGEGEDIKIPTAEPTTTARPRGILHEGDLYGC